MDGWITLFNFRRFFLSVNRNSESPIGADQLEDQDAGHFQKSSCPGITVQCIYLHDIHVTCMSVHLQVHVV